MLASDVVVDLNMLDVFVEDIIMSNVDSTTIVQGSLLYIIIYTSIYRLFSLSLSLYIVNRYFSLGLLNNDLQYFLSIIFTMGFK